ncbi:hypothetical protein [Paenibacillus whitsoniae]|uniref:Uncharacterized protein n=1 Tax=Paenibacillus whitsoniae TaxID=2496558 RepID=A0A3S0CE51_9BACL|nr:hypothetical protein [Paenibacillus whitsoniae]RTE10665.1 hypothetical protein EJQ19_05170 [Paenibacillus whitsoniae]
MSRKTALWTLVGSQLFYLLFVFVWLFVSGMSVMMFDSLDASGSAMTWTIFISIILYPAGLLAGLIGSWIMFARRKYRAAMIWNGIPLVWIVPIAGFLVYAMTS